MVVIHVVLFLKQNSTCDLEAIRVFHWSYLSILYIAVENKHNNTCNPNMSFIHVECGLCLCSVLLCVMSGHAHVMFLLCWQVSGR